MASSSDLRVSYPRGGPESKPQFVSLKRSYTELHSELTARAPSEHPTLCLRECVASTDPSCS